MTTRGSRSGSDPRESEINAATEALAFASRWVPSGGADSYEIFVTFGLTPAQFGARLRDALDSPEVRRRFPLSPDEHANLVTEAHRVTQMSWPADSTQQVS